MYSIVWCITIVCLEVETEDLEPQACEIRAYMSHSCSLIIPSGSSTGFLANILTRDNCAVPQGIVSLKAWSNKFGQNTPWPLLNPVYEFGNFHWSMSCFIDANHIGHISPTFCYVIPQVYSSYLRLTLLDFTHTYGILYYAIIHNTDSWRRPCPLPQQRGQCTHCSACRSCETIRTLMLVKQRLRLSHLAIDKAL
jgi:hypothetical protein